MKDGKNIERAELLIKRLNGDIELGVDSAMITPALLRDMLQDLLAEIAALREARAALEPVVREVPGAWQEDNDPDAPIDAPLFPDEDDDLQPDPLDVARAAETARMDAGFTRALAEMAAEHSQPSPFADDAPATPQRAPKLTRAQRDALAVLYDAATMDVTKFWVKYPSMSSTLKRYDFPYGFVPIDRYAYGIHRPQADALVRAGYAKRESVRCAFRTGNADKIAHTMIDGLCITPAGRDALAAAQRDGTK